MAKKVTKEIGTQDLKGRMDWESLTTIKPRLSCNPFLCLETNKRASGFITNSLLVLCTGKLSIILCRVYKLHTLVTR